LLGNQGGCLKRPGRKGPKAAFPARLCWEIKAAAWKEEKAEKQLFPAC
jgi:hypothetical protein